MSAYGNAHGNTNRTRGLAKTHLCSCGKPAKDWALQKDRATELHWGAEEQRWYSTNADDYDALCRSCHKKLDDGGAGLLAWQQQNPQMAFEQRSAAGKNGIAAATPKLGGHRKQLAHLNHTVQRRCLVCGLVFARTGVGRHQQVSGHQGFEEI